MNRKSIVRQSKRIVVKIGSSILCDEKGFFSPSRVERISRQILVLLKADREVVLVSSGAIACGMDMLRLARRPKELPLLQACAAIGQGKLMKVYESYFVSKKIHTAQVLVTRDIFQERERYLNTRNTLDALLELKALPIVNENDTVATEEIRFGDNDQLSAVVSQTIKADLLINLSNVNGLLNEEGQVTSVIIGSHELKSARRWLFTSHKEKTVGGMASKLEAAGMLMKSGIPMIIANGHDSKIIQKILEGEDAGTLFLGQRKGKS